MKATLSVEKGTPVKTIIARLAMLKALQVPKAAIIITH